MLLGGLGFAFAKTWTVMVFLNADNNLEEAGIDDVNEMELAVDTSLYEVYVLFDRTPGYDNSNGNWTGTRLYRILPDSDPSTINSQLIKDCGELNMGDPATIVWFVDTVRQLSTSDYYWLILWNHGSGWDKGGNYGIKGVSYDDTDNDHITVAGGELRWALDSIFTLLGENLGIISYDACLMGLLEVEYETKDFADATVHSQETEPFDGYPYDDILNWLNSNPNATPQELAHNVAYIYTESYRPGGSQYSQSDVTHSAVDMGPWYTRYYLALDDFARELIKAGGLSNSAIQSAYDNAQRYYDSDFMDVYDFARRITQQGSLPSELLAAAQRLMDIQGDGSSWIDTALIGSYYYEEDDFWSNVSNSHGISVYAPSGSPNSAYSGLYWSTNSAWYWFIQGKTSLPAEPLITYQYNSLGDSIPYGRVSMKVQVRNSGGADASGVVGSVYTQDPYVTVLQGNLTFGNVLSEGVAESAESLVVQVSSTIPIGHRVTFFMDISASGGYTNTTSWNMIATGQSVLAGESAPLKDPVLLARSLPGRRAELVFDPQGFGRVAVYGPSGRLVAVLWEGGASEAVRLTWKAPKAGAYFVRLESERRSITKKIALF